nr:hypothetical protein [Burkholderia sp. IMCC1007]
MFYLVAKHHDPGAIVLTSNLTFMHWATALADGRYSPLVDTKRIERMISSTSGRAISDDR